MDINEIIPALEAILFAAGEPVLASRVALVLGAETGEVYHAAEKLRERYELSGHGIRLLRLGDKLQLCSAPEYAQLVTRALEQRKPPKLSPAALEVLAIVAYFQPVTRAYIDQVRGVDSAYTVGVLLDRGLIESAGKLEVPGRPTIYKTGDVFLRTMNISDLSELPSLPDTGTDEGIIALQNKIEALRAGEAGAEAPPAEGEAGTPAPAEPQTPAEGEPNTPAPAEPQTSADDASKTPADAGETPIGEA